jgi:outer membrane protein insertion porin family
VSQDFAGLAGDVRYIRSRVNGTKYWGVLGGSWILSAHAEGGYIYPLEKSPGPGRDAIRITDRFFGTQLRGFDIRGIGPRIIRESYDASGNIDTDAQDRVSDALGGRAYYMGRIELEFPTSSSLKSFGLRPSAFVDVGSVWGLKKPLTEDILNICTSKVVGVNSRLQRPGDPACDPNQFTIVPGFRERFVGNSAKPRLSVGIGVNWVSPFGPLRLDLAKAILKQEGDDTKLFSFNVGTQF